MRLCSDPGYNKKRSRLVDDTYGIKRSVLGEPRSHDVIVFTRDLGPVPGKATSLYCRSMLQLPRLRYLFAD